MYLDLTNKQAMIFEFIKEQQLAKGYPPSVREICSAVGLKSTSTVHSHLNKLEKLGYIRRDPTKPRAIEILNTNSTDDVTGMNQEIIHIPVVGQITAGEPILAEQNIEEYIPLPSILVQGRDNFILKVKGESMIGAGILDKDYVIVDKNNHASNSQIVVALINGEYATVKRFFKEDRLVRLQPENEFMDSIILDKEQQLAKGYPPSVREICSAVGLKTTSTVHSHLNKLEKLGYIRRDPTKPRAIEILNTNSTDDVTGMNQEIIQIPVVGQITAGEPILAEQNIEEYIPLPSILVQGRDNFILKVKGESMIGAGILDKDYVIVDKNNHASNAQIVVALINGEYATVKRFFKEDRLVRLQPENEFMDSIILDERNIEIVGIVKGVFRTL